MNYSTVYVGMDVYKESFSLSKIEIVNSTILSRSGIYHFTGIYNFKSAFFKVF